MNRIKYSLIFISASLIFLVSGCGVLPPPFFFNSYHHSDRHRDREDRKVHINSGEKFHEKLQSKIHDKLEKMKIKIMNKNDSLGDKMNRMHDRLEHMHIKIDSLNKELIILNDSFPSDMNIEINLDKLDETINSSLEDLDKEIELSVNGSLVHLEDMDIDDKDMEDFDINHDSFDIKFEKIDGDKVMIIKYFDEDLQEWKEIKINMPRIKSE
ncbi:MAG TPA: hypothetical protein VIL99_18130 [Ignavibacteria bacterium]